MIPLNIYQSKISDLHFILSEMGAEPHTLAAWLLDTHHKGDIQLAKARSSAYASLALVSSMPKFTGASVLGMKLTESKAAQKRQEVLEQNQNGLYEEISQIESIQSSLHNLLGMVQNRLYAARRVRETMADKAKDGGKGSVEADAQVSYLDKSVIPLLKALQSEIEKGILNCVKELASRRTEIEAIDRRQLALPKLARKVRRRRLARLKARMAAEAAAKAAAEGGDKKPDGGAGGGAA